MKETYSYSMCDLEPGPDDAGGRHARPRWPVDTLRPFRRCICSFIYQHVLSSSSSVFPRRLGPTMITASTLLRLGLAFSTVVIVHYVAKLLHRVFHPYFSPLRDLKGPKSTSLFYGNLKEIFTAEAMELHERWREEYGPVYKYKGFFNVRRPPFSLILFSRTPRCRATVS